jgi:hypothetical protein
MAREERLSNALQILADVPGRARFAIHGWREYHDLPIRVRDAMLDQIAVWRQDEKG